MNPRIVGTYRWIGGDVPIYSDGVTAWIAVDGPGGEPRRFEASACCICGTWTLHGDGVELHDAHLCSRCSNAVMNLEHHKRSGEYITWENPPVDSGPKKARITPGLRREVYERDAYACRYCGARRGLTLDHVLPESRGGEVSAENLVTCCQPCNSRKGARTPDEAGMTLHPPEAFA